jgi:hypothetical protein
MEKRYQVFVSSTYADLKDERRRVLQTLMEMDCIPAGMELFPAADEEQWAFIRRVIDDCDYYLLIVGGRYGSVTSEGISYTEKEYDYAVAKSIKVVAILHSKPEDIPMGKSELDPQLRARLESFREKVSTGSLVRFWDRAEDLPGIVALSLSRTIKTYPAIGWVRANTVASEAILTQVNQLRVENDSLRAEIAANVRRPPKPIENIAGLEESFSVNLSSSNKYGRDNWKYSLSWREIFGFIAPHLVSYQHETSVKSVLRDAIVNRDSHGGYNHSLEDQDFRTIGIQLKALGLVKIDYLKSTDGTMALYWGLTPSGEQLMLELRVVRRNP